MPRRDDSPPAEAYDDDACCTCGRRLPEDPDEGTWAFRGFCDPACALLYRLNQARWLGVEGRRDALRALRDLRCLAGLVDRVNLDGTPPPAIVAGVCEGEERYWVRDAGGNVAAETPLFSVAVEVYSRLTGQDPDSIDSPHETEP